MKHLFKSFTYVAVTVLATFIVSCRKEVSIETGASPATPATTTSADKLKDSVLLYAKDIYLWYKQIPADFNARSYADPDKIMQAIRQYSIEPGFTNPVDRWSFAYLQSDWNNVSSGVALDFGLNIFFMAEGDLRVRAVEKDSPAGKAGIRRGWKLTAINGNTNITTANADFISQNVYGASSGKFTFVKPDGTSVDIQLAAANYQEHPVFLDTVYTTANVKTGYMVFNSFLGDTTEIYNRFQQVFNRFASENISNLVIDLRYNGGGYVSMQEKLADYIVNNQATGGMMMKESFNDKYTQLDNTTFFKKAGALNLGKVFFIVSKNTASASELLINNLKPYMDVKLVGPSSTYGKPVGFFPIPVGDWYIFPVSFRSVNKNGEGNYFNGLAVDNQVKDGLDKDWGDRTESCLASILKYVTTGSFGLADKRITANQAAAETPLAARVNEGNATFERHEFKGAVDTRRIAR